MEYYTAYPECKPRYLDLHNVAVVALQKCAACKRYYMKIRETAAEVNRECAAECPCAEYRKPYNGRRHILHKRNGERQFVSRRRRPFPRRPEHSSGCSAGPAPHPH